MYKMKLKKLLWSLNRNCYLKIVVIRHFSVFHLGAIELYWSEFLSRKKRNSTHFYFLQVPTSNTVPNSSNKTKNVQPSFVKLGKISDIGCFLIGFLLCTMRKDRLHPSQNRNGKFMLVMYIKAENGNSPTDQSYISQVL